MGNDESKTYGVAIPIASEVNTVKACNAESVKANPKAGPIKGPVHGVATAVARIPEKKELT